MKETATKETISGEGTAQLNLCGWFLEQEKKTEAALHQMRAVMGTFETDQNTTYHFLQGYLSGLRSFYRRSEQ